MFEGKRIGAILLMGGVGQRFGSEIPKQFHLLHGKKVYEYPLQTLVSTGFFDEMVIVSHPDWPLVSHVPVVKGGKTRQESSYLGLKALGTRPEIVLIHDAVRPFVTEKIIRENLSTAITWGAANTCMPSTDTLVYAPGKEKISAIPKREEYLRGQTPQTFRRDWILEAHEKALREGIENATDDCSLVFRLGRPIHIVQGEERNMKITSPFDLWIAEQLSAVC